MATKMVDHPLVRDGKSQSERLDLGALAPGALALDDHSERQLLVYLYEYAKSVAFYDLDGTVRNWQDFFRSGVAVQSAIIGEYNPANWHQQFEGMLQGYADGLNRSNLSPVLDFLFETAIRIDGWQSALANETVLVDGKLMVNENDLQRNIRNLIASNLSTALAQLIAIANVWADKSVSGQQRNYDLPNLSRLDSTSGVWNLSSPVFAARDVALQKLISHPPEFEQAAKQKLDNIYKVFFKAILDITTAAQTINLIPPTETHEPHLGLLYAFLRLFKQVRNSLNGMTRQHLDFYYRDVLGLKTKPHQPDTAHVVFELNKPASPDRLIAKTPLKGGKDSKGAEIVFELENEIIVSKAQIQSLRTLFNETKQTTDKDNVKKIYAAPVANSADGLGGAFQDPALASWPTLGAPNGQLTARVGLMIASPALRLEEGVRDIEISMNIKGLNWYNFTDQYEQHGQEGNPRLIRFSYKPTDETFKLLSKSEGQKIADKIYVGTEALVKAHLPTTQDPEGLLKTFEKTGPFIVELSGKKGWFKPATTPVFYTNNKIVIHLSADEEPIADANPETLKANYGIAQPLVRLTLNPHIFSDKDTSQSLYGLFEKISLNGVSLKITVSDLRNVAINTDEGVADPKKVFLPFGPLPVPGKRFSVDHPAFYGSKFEKYSLVFEWDQLPLNGFPDHYLYYNKNVDNNDFFKTTIKFGQLSEQDEEPLFNDFENKRSKFLFPPDGIAADTLNAPVIFTLQSEFFHRDYPAILAAQLIISEPPPQLPADMIPITQTHLEDLKAEVDEKFSQAGDCDSKIDDIKDQIKTDIDELKSAVKGIPPAPDTPIIKSVTLSYVVTAGGSDVTMFHLHPFEEGNHQKINPGSPLIPAFDFEGALLIGLNEVTPGSMLDLLFQFNETSADAYLAPAELNWYYLRENEWTPMEKGKQVIHDDTKGFIRSGIVQLVMPFDIDLKPTFLPKDICWLKVSAGERTAAVCRAIGVHTQAAKAVFRAESASDLSRLNKPLDAGSISKLAEPNTTIKGVQQPYASFGGRAPEEDNAFYARVSEQLRHKGRAVSLFDYEQLVLEAFPDIYKVKCITHTLAPRVGGAMQNKYSDHEAAPGYVTIVVIPKLAHLPVADRFQPQASPGQLEAIKGFLTSRISPFVRLRVMNPLYDLINTRIQVAFKTGRSPEFYKEQLKTDLKQYLSPWAFNPDAKIPFGGTVHQSAILGFIEGRDYIEYVKEFSMWKNNEEKDREDPGTLTTTAARAILVSGKHKINEP